jgi:hypothetical protein
VSWIWAMLLGVTPIIAALCRNPGLCRHALRRASIERAVRDRTGVIRIADPTAEGGLLSVEVLPCPEGAPEPDLRCAGA